MKSFFTAEFFKHNRQQLRKLVGNDAPIIVTANGLLQRNGDGTFPFRQDSSFWYLTGIDEPDVILVMKSNEEYLILPEREKARVAFDGQPTAAQFAKRSGVKQVIGRDDGWQRLSKSRRVQTLTASPAYVEYYGLYTNPARARLTRQLQERGVKLIDIKPQIAKLRAIKQPEEIEAIQSAIALTALTFKEIHKKRMSYNFEYDVEADIARSFRKNNALYAYQPIVASGVNACTLHYVANTSELRKDQLLLIDAGAEVENYAADITRTFSLGSPTPRQMEVLGAAMAVQLEAQKLLKAGITLKEFEQQVEHCMGETLAALGLIKRLTRRSIRKYFPHATSHFLGLDVHDVGDYNQPLEAGMVLTIEPGIYIPKEQIGIRIEENVLINEAGGVTVLSGILPMSL